MQTNNMDVLDRVDGEREGLPTLIEGQTTNNTPNSPTRSESFTKAVQEKPHKAVNFKMMRSDEMELMAKANNGMKNGTSNGNENLKDFELAGSGGTGNINGAIDFVLVYEEKTGLDEEEKREYGQQQEKRTRFETSLEQKGLLLQYVNSDLNEVRCLMLCLITTHVIQNSAILLLNSSL